MRSSTLSVGQKEILDQFQKITQIEETEDALGWLLEKDWNIEDYQRAIQNVYDASLQEKHLEEEVASSVTHYSSTSHKKTFLSTLIYWPFGLACQLILILLSAFRLYYQPKVKEKEPHLAAKEFIKTFKSKYGDKHVGFYRGGYGKALEKAKRELRFLLVMLHDKSNDTTRFCRETLVSSKVIEFMEEKNILIWSGNIWDSEANKVGYKLKASAYPFMALIALQAPYNHVTPKMSVVERMEGYSHPEELISQLGIAVERYGSVLYRLNNDRERRDSERKLKEEQDNAYLQSLEADKEKARKIEQEEKALALEIERLEIQKEKRAQYINYLYAHLPNEPTEGETVRLCFKLADGDKIVRRFRKDDTLKTIYDFVQVYSLIKQNVPKSTEPISAPDDYRHRYSFNIHSCFPKMEYEPADTHKLSNIQNLWPSATLIVDTADDDDED